MNLANFHVCNNALNHFQLNSKEVFPIKRLKWCKKMAHYWQHCSQKNLLGIVSKMWNVGARTREPANDRRAMKLCLSPENICWCSINAFTPAYRWILTSVRHFKTAQNNCVVVVCSSKKSSIYEVSLGLTTVKWKKQKKTKHRVWYYGTNPQWQCCVLKAENEIKIITNLYFFWTHEN